MFKIESYVTPILLSYVDKYVRDFKPADAQVSLWGGGVALHNLVLKADVLQQEVALPFTLVSGRIHELLIQVPWTKIMSEPIIVTIDTIECVLGLNPQSGDEAPPPESPSRKTQVVEAPPGYMQALVRRIVSNIALRVHHLIVKYVQDDIVLSLNVKHLAVDSAGPNWEAAFADIDQIQPVIRRLVRLDDLTLCLDRADSDGKIRLYQEPLLYRCQLDFRILTRLVSATTRRATNLSIQLRSSKLAWGVTNDQLTLLLRLVRERSNLIVKPPSPAPKSSNSNLTQPMHVTSSNSAEPARLESWSEWAWSWLPSWTDKEGVEEPALPPACVPVNFAAYFDDVTVVFKSMETEGSNRKRARGILELHASHSAFKSYICKPTTMRIKFGTRLFTVLSKGKCVCGHVDYNAANEEPTIYLSKEQTVAEENEWQWPEDQKQLVETAQAIDEQYRATPELQEVPPPNPSHPDQPESQPQLETKPDQSRQEDADEFWLTMNPQVYMEFTHERSPPEVYTNPYDNPPDDFQYSDWVEDCEMKICLEASVLNVCMGLIHRLMVLKNIIQDLPPVPAPDVSMRTLTVEECESLGDNMPQSRVTIETKGLIVRVIPWEHGLERPDKPVLVLALDMPKNHVMINGPLYPHRVCSAACQMPEDNGALWQGARLHVTVNINSVQARICSEDGSQTRPCGRMDLIAVAHVLLNKEYFAQRESVHLGYSVKIREANICGSSARLQAAWQIPSSLLRQELSTKLKYTTLVEDALKDEQSVAIDLTIEDLVVRGFYTKHIITHIVTLQSAKATALHDTPETEHPNQAWLFSFPDAPTSSPYLRLAVQWCSKPIPNSLDYAGIWTEPAAVAVDPLFIAWMAYKPQLKPAESQSSITLLKGNTSSHYFLRRRNTPPSSSGRGLSKSGSATELVHNRTRSVESSEKTKQTPPQHKSLYFSWTSDDLLKMHERLRRMLVNMEIGLTLVYITMSTASALDCETVRDAMERHAALTSRVLALNFGRLTMYSSTLKRNFWNDIMHDGPTFVAPLQENQEPADQFPWRMRLADVSCYILEVKAGVDSSGKDKSTTGLRSQLKTSCVATPRTVLELVTTTVTLSVVTKTAPLRPPHAHKENRKTSEPTTEDRTKFFTKGGTFKPTTLKEFVRGPANRKKERMSDTQEKPPELPKEPETSESSGPVVSLGVNLHADTPPLIIRLDHDQVHIVAAAVHCFTHILALLKRPPLIIPNKFRKQSMASVPLAPSRTLIRSVSELDETRSSEESRSENRSDLISIYEAVSVRHLPLFNIKTFFWFQWVVSRITLVAATSQVKLALDIDDIISTVDLQSHYNQFKVKVASLSLRHYERTESDEWQAGVLGGRVIEVREPTDSKEDNHFLTITMTQAQISNLPASWREELHPKLLEQKNSYDTMWEIYATLAPLEAIVEPKILENIVSLVVEIAPRSFCPLQKEKDFTLSQTNDWQWPFLYVTAGGLRLLLTVEDKNDRVDDTFMFVIGRVIINPYPENPICRRAINTGTEGGWLTSGGGIEGRQYELMIKNVGIMSAKFWQIIDQENSEGEMSRGTSSENPAVMWSSTVVTPVITPVLHSVDIGCVIAPALYINDVLTCGPAVELNIVSDCAIELSLDHLVLAQKLVVCFFECIQSCVDQSLQFDEETQGACPYASLLMNHDPDEVVYGNITLITETKSYLGDSLGRTYDSGVDTVTNSTGIKKSLSVVFIEDLPDATDYLEIFITMGTIEVSLYAVDDGSSEINALKPPLKWERRRTDDDFLTLPRDESTKKLSQDGNESAATRSKSQPDSNRNEDIAKNNNIESIGNIKSTFPIARKEAGNIPLAHISLHQPNLYYWGRKTQRNIQVSLFDAWVGLGAGGSLADSWTAVLLSTAKGQPDPVTDIPPALATLKVVVPCSVATPVNMQRGSICLDVERPVLFEVSYDRLRRIKGIVDVLNQRTVNSPLFQKKAPTTTSNVSPFYKLKTLLVHQSVESVRVQLSQVGVSGSAGACGWGGLTILVRAAFRPDTLTAKVLLSSAVISSGPSTDARHVVMQPVMMGLELDATWEAWRRAEGGLSAKEPMIKVSFELDCVTLDLRPEDLKAIECIREALDKLSEETDGESKTPEEPTLSSADNTKETVKSTVVFDQRPSIISFDNADDNFYKDDLRSGAFKIVSGGQLPMAYQVTLHNNAVSWRYPHPRAITRLVAFPLPGEDEETPCVLELYNQILGCWEIHTYFSIPVGEPRELQLYVPSPECAFAVMWRFRVYEGESRPTPYEFNIHKFQPRADMPQDQADIILPKPKCGVTTEQLSGVVRVDSCFSPRLFPRVRIVTRMTQLAVYLHNGVPCSSSKSTSLEGYYVSKPLMRSHRVLSLSASDLTVHMHLASPAGKLFLIQANIASDIMECATGSMEQLVAEFRLQAAGSQPSHAPARARVAVSRIHAALHVPRVRTLHSLCHEYHDAVVQHILQPNSKLTSEETSQKHETCEISPQWLEGRVSLWIHNSCVLALRVGQEGTDEVVPLGPNDKLAYRWRSPTAPKKLRFARAGPSTDWQWSSSIPFTLGSYKVRIQDREIPNKQMSTGVYLYANVEESGARRTLVLSGRLCLANMLRYGLLYKVRALCSETNQWGTVCSGEMAAESVGRNVVVGTDCEMALKIKFNGETGWSGDIPLKECPKENVPWLVKLPSEGELEYMSVWCRVVRGRIDGRVLATVWPLYVLYSHLPLDTDVLIMTDAAQGSESPPPLVQTAPGRGASTHLLAPGTTAARHNLSFQYRHIDCPVTKEAVPLHYGVTDTSVFDKRAPINVLDTVIEETLNWIERSGRDAKSKWPYSLVTKHWPNAWGPALLQPRCDVSIRYRPVRVGGGCSLEMQVCPVVLLCNAAPIALTLRAHDAAPLCKLEPGSAISPPSAVISKPFFISVETGRETFVSGELSICRTELGRYGTPQPGRVSLDRSTELAIQCTHKVALLTLYYEIKEDINVLGMSSTYLLINRLDTSIKVSAMAVPGEVLDDVSLRPTTMKVVEPTPDGSVFGTPLCRFYVAGRWRGSDPTELRLYLCLALGHEPGSPVRIGRAPVRRSIAVLDDMNNSVPLVVTQIKHEGRWVITVSKDPCPQLLIHNKTNLAFAVGEPAKTTDEPSTSKITVTPDCEGARWHCTVQPRSLMHYSTPSHCLRYPPPNETIPHPPVVFITLAKPKEEIDPEWCPPVAITDGEQLVQLANEMTVKLKVRSHPHSTHIELKDVDHTDIAASDIRRRLLGAFSSQEIIGAIDPTQFSQALERTLADDNILDNIEEAGTSENTSLLPEPSIEDTKTGDKENVQTVLQVAQEVKPLMDVIQSQDDKSEPSTLDLYKNNTAVFDDNISKRVLPLSDDDSDRTASILQEVPDNDWDETSGWSMNERLRVIAGSVAVEFSSLSDTRPLLALHLDRAAVIVKSDVKKTRTLISISDVQIDNLQYESGQFDFAVVAATRGEPQAEYQWPALWNMFLERRTFSARQADARALVKLTHDSWEIAGYKYNELSEVECNLGPLAVYIEDAYVRALANLARSVTKSTSDRDVITESLINEERALSTPLRLKMLHIHPLHLTLTLHTAVRMYIALDQSPLRLGAFKLHDAMTSCERLTHALTVHYLSAAILGAGWVVGGLELLGAPGAVAARVGGATGGVRGLATAAAAALLHSLSAWAGSLARNLDLLAGDEEHAQRAAAARRRPPMSLIAGLTAGMTNFAINILGAVGGLAHHPLVGVAVGETESSATALRRGLIGAFAKPLSATADLVAYAGHGLLYQTGWELMPQARVTWSAGLQSDSGWRRDCVRWSFRLAELTAIAGFHALLDGVGLLLLFTHKYLVVAEPDSERIVEMIDFKSCSVGPYQGQIIELVVKNQRRPSRLEARSAEDEDDEIQISAAAMARVARYTGTEPTSTGVESRVLSLLPSPRQSLALYAALAAACHHNSEAHFPLL